MRAAAFLACALAAILEHELTAPVGFAAGGPKQFAGRLRAAGVDTFYWSAGSRSCGELSRSPKGGQKRGRLISRRRFRRLRAVGKTPWDL